MLAKRGCALRPFACLIALGVLGGCWHASSSDIPGRYEAHEAWGDAKLVLDRRGGTKEEVRLRTGRVLTLIGRWELEEGTLSRLPCLGLRHDGVDEKPIGVCLYSVNGYGVGHVEISLDPSFGLAYRK